MNKTTLFIFFLFVTVKSYAVNEYIPEQPNPLSQSWRWHQLGQFNTAELANFIQDSSGIIWASFNNTNTLLKSYNGYTWKEYPHNENDPVGKVNKVIIAGDSILVGGTSGLVSFKNGNYKYILKNAKQANKKVKVLSIKIVWDSCIVISTNYGLIFKEGEQFFFYTRKEHVEYFTNQFKGIKVLPIQYDVSENDRDELLINDLVERNNGDLWIFIQFGKSVIFKVQRTKEENNPIGFFPTAEIKGRLQFGGKTKTWTDGNEIWVVSNSIFRPASWFNGKQWQTIRLQARFGNSNEHYSIVHMNDNHVLIGGISEIYDFYSNKYIQFKKPEIPVGKSSPVELVKTNDGNLLVGIRNKIYYVEYGNTAWHSYNNLLYQCEAKDGKKWFISKQNQVISIKGVDYKAYNTADGLIDAPVSVAISSRGTVWCSGSHNNLAAFAFYKNGYWHKTVLDTLASSLSKYSGFEDKNGDLWFGSGRLSNIKNAGGIVRLRLNMEGIKDIKHYSTPKNINAGFAHSPDGEPLAFTVHSKYIYKKEKDAWELVPIAGVPVLAATQSADSSLWMATMSKGLFIWDKQGVHKFKMPEFLNIKTFTSIHYTNNALWLVSDEEFYTFYKNQWLSEVLPSEILNLSDKCDILSDGNGKIWMNIYPEEWVDRVFHGNNYNKQSPFLTNAYKSDTFAPIMINIQYNSEVDHRGNTRISWQGADYYKRTPNEKLLYSYKISGNEWTDFTTQTFKTFTSLSYGNHNFQVRCMDTDLNISSEPMFVTFKVFPPVYRQPWFIILISTLLGIILFLVYRAIHRNRALQVLNNNLTYANKQLKESQVEILLQRDEIYQSKLQFFTNISHEFRTPLTLILGPLKKIISFFNKPIETKPVNIEEKKDAIKMSEIAHRNAKQLLYLVNEIMDFRKLETGHMKLGAQKTDIISFCRELADSFNELARQKQIKFQIKTGNDSELLYIDKGKMNKVITNLLSNAFKYTPEGGTIKLFASAIESPLNSKLKNRLDITGGEKPLKDFFEIIIEDNGVGISQQSITSIFTRFYQAGENDQNVGSGIGLALSKDLVLLHKGDLIVQSSQNVGSRFTVRLPYGTEHLNKDQIIKPSSDELVIEQQYTKPIENISNEPINEPINTESKQVLIVDDNADIKDYISDNLKKTYNIKMAANGKEGLVEAFENQPDLIISDVMMPVMNGIEFCKQLKTDIRTSHIPVIMLTARTSKKHQLEGLETGADIYIPKPFDIDILELQIRNLLRNKEKLAQKLKEQGLNVVSEVSYNSLDQQFIEQLNTAIKENLSDPDFTVDVLCNGLGMSRRNFHRKLKNISDSNPAELLRNARLTYAMELIEKTDYNIAEIAFQSGFNYSTTFHRLFKEKYNCSPLEYQTKYKKNKE